MSRTYKDRPRRVRDLDLTTKRRAEHNHEYNNGECDLAEGGPTREAYFARWCHAVGAEWYYSPSTPTRGDIRDAWWGPQRARERDTGRTMTHQFNTTGSIDDAAEPAPVQHRRSVTGNWD